MPRNPCRDLKGKELLKCQRKLNRKQQTILVDLPKAGELKPFTTRADIDKLVKERFEELDLKEKGWKCKYDDRKNVFISKDGTTLLYRKGYKQSGGSDWYVATDYDILQSSFKTKEQARNYAIKWMKRHPSR